MFESLMPFVASVALGLLIGIERERSNSLEGQKPVIGARTFPLLAMLGTLIAFVDSDIMKVSACVFVITMTVINHVSFWNTTDSERGQIGFTTALAAVITFVLGYLAESDSHKAIIIAVILFGFLSVKSKLHDFARTGITKGEMSASLTFLVSAFVILPLLPVGPVDSWGLIYPRRIWLLFVLIAGVEFSSYIALKQMGQRWGTIITGFLGGFASATATTLSLVGIKSKPSQIPIIAGGIILAEVSSLLVQLIILFSIAPNSSLELAPLLGAPALIGLICAAMITKFCNDESSIDNLLTSENPISIKKTAIFALMISGGLIVLALASRWFGEAGIYLTSALGGALSLRVVTFSVGELADSKEIAFHAASTAILIAMTVNMFVKLGIIIKVGSRRLTLVCFGFFSLMIAGGFAAYFFR